MYETSYFLSLVSLGINILLAYVILLLNNEIEKQKIRMNNTEAQAKTAFELVVQNFNKKRYN